MQHYSNVHYSINQIKKLIIPRRIQVQIRRVQIQETVMVSFWIKFVKFCNLEVLYAVRWQIENEEEW